MSARLVPLRRIAGRCVSGPAFIAAAALCLVGFAVCMVAVVGTARVMDAPNGAKP